MVGWPPDWSLYILNIPVPIISLYNPLYIYSNCGRFTPHKIPTFLVVSCNSFPHFPTFFWTYYSHWYPRSNSPCFHRRWCEDPSSPFQTLAGPQLGLASQVGLFLARTIGSSVPSCEGSREAQGLFLLDESGWWVQRFFLVFVVGRRSERDEKMLTILGIMG